MKEYLDSLRKKPKAVRERIAIGASLGTSGVIALGWLMVMIFVTPYGGAPAPSEEFNASLSETRSSFTDVLAGAGAAGATTTRASGVEIVDTTPNKPADATPSAIAF
ncbi:MAG: hypothetical protein KBC38_00100 [Candidatus Pacebacteria bacterium]|nr:hypothetical protein [Candidatus Paceibacterota bacterium]MBP9840404.1 hypothetical protein [Candidatus Paceibacterota bacterium]